MLSEFVRVNMEEIYWYCTLIFFLHWHWFASGQWHIQVSWFIPKRRAKRRQSFQYWFATNACPLSLVLIGRTMESLENSEVHIHQSLASPNLQWSWKNVFISGSYVLIHFSFLTVDKKKEKLKLLLGYFAWQILYCRNENDQFLINNSYCVKGIFFSSNCCNGLVRPGLI